MEDGLDFGLAVDQADVPPLIPFKVQPVFFNEIPAQDRTLNIGLDDFYGVCLPTNPYVDLLLAMQAGIMSTMR